MKSLTIFLAVASLLTFLIIMPAEAGVEVLNPYTGIVWESGSTEKISWKENNNAPLLTSLKSLTITLMAGKQDAQFPAAVIASGVDGSSLSMSYTVPRNVGPAGSFYFLKFSQDNYLAYSGYFTINGVSGTIPNFDPKNPGASTTTSSRTTSSSSSSTSTTATTSLNSTRTTSSTTNLSETSKVTAKSVSKDSSETAKPQAPEPKSSSSNKLTTSFSALSLALFFIAFYLF